MRIKMHINELKYLVSQFRNGVETAFSKNQFKEQPFNNFPNACCGDAPLLVAQYIMDHDPNNSLQFRYVYGRYYNDDFEKRRGHAWLEVIWPEIKKKVIVDIASDQRQFCYSDIFPRCASVPFYVGRKNEFYSLFEVTPSQCYRIYGLDEINGKEHLRMRKLYEIILQHIVHQKEEVIQHGILY